jgi:SAM-dependent methyltransferase
MSRSFNLRTTFNSEAELYHAVRPRYPEALFEALIEKARLRDGAKLLEIGPGTGQATEPLAKRGYDIIAIELGDDLAEVARKALGKYENVRIVAGAFEDVELPQHSFDLVCAATAFHWIRPEFKFTKSHGLLKERGHLAIIGTNHVSDGKGDEFFLASQPIYKKYKPGGMHDESFRLNRTDEVKAEEVDENLFTPIFFRAFPLVVPYSAKKYSQLLATYSPTISMEANRRATFLEEIERLIEEKFGGSIQKHFAMTLTIATKKKQ